MKKKPFYIFYKYTNHLGIPLAELNGIFDVAYKLAGCDIYFTYDKIKPTDNVNMFYRYCYKLASQNPSRAISVLVSGDLFYQAPEFDFTQLTNIFLYALNNLKGRGNEGFIKVECELGNLFDGILAHLPIKASDFYSYLIELPHAYVLLLPYNNKLYILKASKKSYDAIRTLMRFCEINKLLEIKKYLEKRFR